MERMRHAPRGQVLIIFVFAVVGLIGITGLAIDGGNSFSDRRHAQNAADTAALAAALTKIHAQKALPAAQRPSCNDFGTESTPPSTCASTIILAGLNMAGQNGYDGSGMSANAGNTVQVNVPPTEGIYSECGSSLAFDCHDYVEVIIDTRVETFFARVLGIPYMENHVQAVARARYEPSAPLFGGNTLVSLSPGDENCNAEFDLGGSGQVTLTGGGIFVNSDSSCAAVKDESNCVDLKYYDANGNLVYPKYDESGQLEEAAIIQGVPGAVLAASSCADAPTLTHDTEQLQFPPDPLIPEEPAECHITPPSHANDADGYTHLEPGHYASLPPDKNTRLYPGVYCVDNVLKVTNPQSHLEGDGVMIYIRNIGAASPFSLEGGYMHLTAITDENSPYRGYLIYVASNFTGSPGNCKINGDASSYFEGVIYAPYCDIEILGTSSPTGYMAQIIGYTIKLSGTSNLSFTYNADDMPQTPEINQTGLMR